MSDTVKGMMLRTERLLGPATAASLQQAKVIVFGVGGVGSWAAESLVRSGICHLTIVDADYVAASNINRQLMATSKTVGQVKVEALKERLLDINPEAEITAIQQIYTPETAEQFALEDYDYILDCIDSLSNKALLILNATRTNRVFFSSMGAALKLDPTKVKVAEFWKVEGCPLGARLRAHFRRSKSFPKRKFQCVFSDEVLPNLGPDEASLPALDGPAPMSYNKVASNGSLAHITAIFGFTLAGLVLQHIHKNTQQS